MCSEFLEQMSICLKSHESHETCGPESHGASVEDSRMISVDPFLLSARSAEYVTGNRGTLRHVNTKRKMLSLRDQERLTRRYPPAHPVTIMPMATETLADPKTFPITVGMVAKNPPLAIPLMTTNATRGPSDSDTGHSTSILTALNRRETNSVLRGPTLSLPNPQINRPTADEKLKAATKPAPILEDNLRELAYNGKKNGGTKRGNVATAPAAKRTANRTSRNNLLKA